MTAKKSASAKKGTRPKDRFWTVGKNKKVPRSPVDLKRVAELRRRLITDSPVFDLEAETFKSRVEGKAASHHIEESYVPKGMRVIDYNAMREAMVIEESLPRAEKKKEG